VEYDLQQSQSIVLTNWYLKLMIDQCEKIKREPNDKIPPDAILICKDLDQFNSIDEVRKNVIFLYIYYDNLGYTKITEEPMYDIISLLSSIGGKVYITNYNHQNLIILIIKKKGHLGLFVGMSFLSIIEILEVIIQVFIVIFKTSNKVE
jgi:hypothetical protein